MRKIRRFWIFRVSNHSAKMANFVKKGTLLWRFDLIGQLLSTADYLKERKTQDDWLFDKNIFLISTKKFIKMNFFVGLFDWPVGTYSLGNLFVVYEMRRQVLPTAPSPTTTHFIVCILKQKISKKGQSGEDNLKRKVRIGEIARARPIHALKRVIDW